MTPAAPASSPRERILTVPLTVFLVLVGVILVFAAADRLLWRSAGDPVVALSDGDLDGRERSSRLLDVVEDGVGSEDPYRRWAGLLAAVALGDREGYGEALGRLDADENGIPRTMPKASARGALALGDPMLANVAGALWAEAEGHADRARVFWRQVSAQCQLAPAPFAAELASAALARLR